MVDRFNAVAARRNVDFEAWFSARTESDRSWIVDESRWEFRHRYLRALDRGTSALALPTPLLSGRRPDVFVSLYAGADFLAGSALARKRGARSAFFVEVTYDAWVRRRWWKETLKSHAFGRVDGILTPGVDGASVARRYGARPERIHIVPHVIDFAQFAWAGQLSQTDRAEIRDALGVCGVVFAYVGRLWTGKGLTYLLDAFAELQRADVGNVSLLFVGDGRDEALLRARARENGLRNVAFCGFQHGDVLPRLYGASDVFVFPTLGDPFGMAILEAMACELPVIATTACGEIDERVVDGENGFLVPPADKDRLLEKMTRLAGDAELRRRMGRASRERVDGHAPDLWADAFERAVEKILRMPPVRSTRAHASSSSNADEMAGVR
jgi:glycosyltransferase involved in cell wall biosynthesis